MTLLGASLSTAIVVPKDVREIEERTYGADADSEAGQASTPVSPGPIRSSARPLLIKLQHLYGLGRRKLEESLAAPSVTVYLMGGCANQIFQYAAGLALARRLGVALKLDISWYETATPNMPRQYSLGLFKGVHEPVVHRPYGPDYSRKWISHITRAISQRATEVLARRLLAV